MNALLFSCLLSLNLVAVSIVDPIWPTKRTRPTHLAHFDLGVLITATGKLRVNIDKQLGGPVYVQLLNQHGRVYFGRTLYANKNFVRLNLDISRLPTNTYRLKVSNGLKMITRDVLVAAPSPDSPAKTVALP